MAIRLTKTAKRAGCAAKQPPGYLLPLLERLPAITDPNVMVGNSTADDAAVYRLDDERALVLTTDFFTPIVDDPYDFGAVAAANALSDVYAMGGRPLTALNLVGFPAELDVEILGEILRGGGDKAKEAGIDLVGGHTIKSEEPIYGLAVTGMVHPDRVVSNAGGRPGDRLILTKPLGTGIITTAAKNDEDSRGAIGRAIEVMATLNRAAAEAMTAVGVEEAGVHAATDITGFGLLGHLRNIVVASKCGAVVERAKVPALEAAVAYVEAGIAPGGTHANLRFLDELVDWGAGIEGPDQLLLCDAQTSGGLLICVAPERSEALLEALRERGITWATEIGELSAEPVGRIAVR